MLHDGPPRSMRLLLCACVLASFDVAMPAQDNAKSAPHWSFVRPVRPEPAGVHDGAWCRGPLDTFVLHHLEEQGLAPNPPADPRTLIRRISLDLTGLPPTREEIAAFLRDPSDGAYEAIVDRLLARPQYGEAMARPWLDLVRVADTNGIHHDHFRDTSAYRDWVIRAFNQDLPYDRFVTDQIAGDLREPATDDALIASGFHRLHRIIDVGTALPEESFTNNMVDTVSAFGTAFLGLTLNCAVCHDHKYDPIPQTDFYGLFAFFDNIDAEPETGPRQGTDFRRGLQPPYVEFPSDTQKATLARLSGQIQAADAKLAELRATQQDARPTYFDAQVKGAQQERDRLVGQRDAVLVQVPAALVMKERADIRPTHVLVRGDYQRPGAEVTRHTPAFLPPLPSSAAVPTRMDLARWLVAPEHPLTARVEVNRIWQQFFGVGIVKTAEDFGAKGERPSNQALLDFLAVSFVESGWDVKALVRSIVLSATYRQASHGTATQFERDPENRQLARGPRFRMDAEVIRDQILATAGLLDLEMFGPSVKPPQPAGLWEAVALPDTYPRVHVQSPGNGIFRRSIYTFWKRGLPPPQMTILDAPSREFCVARRERTNTPLQALLLMNETEYLRAARHLAKDALAHGAEPARRLDTIFETITGKLPPPAVREALFAGLTDLREAYRAAPSDAKTLCGDDATSDVDCIELAAWTMTVSAIYDLDTTRTKD